jgi:hypothetical protein
MSKIFSENIIKERLTQIETDLEALTDKITELSCAQACTLGEIKDLEESMLAILNSDSSNQALHIIDKKLDDTLYTESFLNIDIAAYQKMIDDRLKERDDLLKALDIIDSLN